jgi:hypothetical protein
MGNVFKGNLWFFLNFKQVAIHYISIFLLLFSSNVFSQLINGDAVSGEIAQPGEQDTHTFTANAGETIEIRAVDINRSTLTPFLEIYGPLGNLINTTSGGLVAAFGPYVIENNGQHQVIIRDGTQGQNETGSYVIYYTKVPGANEIPILKVDGSLTDSIDLGDLDSYTFSANAGERIQVNVADTSGGSFAPSFNLYDPFGEKKLFTSGGAVAASNPYTLQETGTYTLVVSDISQGNASTGNYELFFVKIPGADEDGMLINGGSVSDQIDLGDIDSFTIDANTGESVQLRVADTNNTTLAPRINLYGPNGDLKLSAPGSLVAATGSYAIPEDGTYTVIVVDGSQGGASTGNYTLHYVRAPGANEGGELVNGETKSDTIELGDLDSYTVDLLAGDNLNLVVTDTSNGALALRANIYDPSGKYVSSGSSASQIDMWYEAASSGIHTIVINDTTQGNASTGGYDITANVVRKPVIVYLDFQNPIPRNFKLATTIWDQLQKVVETNGSMPLGEFTTAQQDELVSTLQQFYDGTLSNRGYGLNILVTKQQPTGDAINVRFASETIVRDGGGYTVGKAYDIGTTNNKHNRFFERKDGNVGVFVDPNSNIISIKGYNPAQLDPIPYIANIVAHEVGHAFGLRHIPIGCYDPQLIEHFIMDRVYYDFKQDDFGQTRQTICDTNWGSETHTPLYHLRHYVTREKDSEMPSGLVAQKGTWDDETHILPTSLAKLNIKSSESFFNLNKFTDAVNSGNIDIADLLVPVIDSPQTISFPAQRPEQFELIAASAANGDFDIRLGLGTADNPDFNLTSDKLTIAQGSIFKYDAALSRYEIIGTFSSLVTPICSGEEADSMTCIDKDSDGVANDVDNCPDVANSGQEDFNNDGLGDVCADSDSDGVLDAQDVCPVDPVNGVDNNGDGCTDSSSKADGSGGGSGSGGGAFSPILLFLIAFLLLIRQIQHEVMPERR